MKELTLDQAIQAAIELNKNVSEKGLAVGFSELEKAVQDFESEGYPIQTIIPQGEDASLGFSLKRADGKKFWEIYSDLIRKSLCNSGGELHKLIGSGISTSVGAVLTAIVSGLGIPVVALGVMIPIAVIIINTGLDAFCAMADKKN